MFVAIFEVHPKAERFDDYLALAKRLRPALEKIDGFVDNERFRSTRRPGWVLSLSTWRDEKSIVRWRTTGVHHIAQKQGRAEILEDYHLRIGDVTADSGAPGKASVHEQRFDETEIGAKLATVTELTSERDAALGRVDVISSLGLDVAPPAGSHRARLRHVRSSGGAAVLFRCQRARNEACRVRAVIGESRQRYDDLVSGCGLSVQLLVTSAAGINGDGYGKLLAFDNDGHFLGPFCDDHRIADRLGAVVKIARLNGQALAFFG
jgi:heme-degrading monooxygenase HmoA